MKEIMQTFCWRNIVLCALVGSTALSNIPSSELLGQSLDFLDFYGEEEEEFENYEQYGEFADMVRDFHIAMEMDEQLSEECGVFSKWGRKLKRWFKNTVKDMVVKFLDLKPEGDPDACAYNVAKIKRRIDKVYKTGSIDDFLQRFDDTVGHSNANLEYFKNRIRYYHNNKKAKPSDKNKPWVNINVDFKAGDELKDVHPNYIFGGLEIACGCLIHVLPFPGCQALGKLLIGDGFIRMGYQKYEDYDKENREDKKIKNKIKNS